MESTNKTITKTMTDTLIVKVIFGDCITSLSFKCIGNDSIEEEHRYRSDVISVDFDEDQTNYISKYKAYKAVRECMREAFDLIETAYDRGETEDE